jgi:hypothetical protein
VAAVDPEVAPMGHSLGGVTQASGNTNLSRKRLPAVFMSTPLVAVEEAVRCSDELKAPIVVLCSGVPSPSSGEVFR